MRAGGGGSTGIRGDQGRAMCKARLVLRGEEGKEKEGAIASFCRQQGHSSAAQTASTRAVEGGQAGRSGVRQAEGARHGNTGGGCVRASPRRPEW